MNLKLEKLKDRIISGNFHHMKNNMILKIFERTNLLLTDVPIKHRLQLIKKLNGE